MLWWYMRGCSFKSLPGQFTEGYGKTEIADFGPASELLKQYVAGVYVEVGNYLAMHECDCFTDAIRDSYDIL